MADGERDVIVVGAGLSGLACALKLQEEGLDVLVLEASDGPGGRVRTDVVDGFLLDRGFQVYLDAYPVAGELLDLPSLELNSFEPGAMVFKGGKLHEVMDVFRRPQNLISSALAPVGSVWDKALVAKLRLFSLRTSLDDIGEHEDQSTEDFLKSFGFSEKMIDGFFRSFYGGIFLENELRTSSRMFEFTFKMFSQGSATLPKRGMGQISEQLANRLPSDKIRYHSPVVGLNGTTVLLESGEELSATKVVVATPFHVARKLLPEAGLPDVGWRGVTNLYFSAPQSPLEKSIIALNGENQGLVNNVAVLTDLSPAYAPAGQALVSVSVLGTPAVDNLPDKVCAELKAWFGAQVSKWKHLKTYEVAHALPEQTPGATPLPKIDPPHYLCGDYCFSASIEGAIRSGQGAARRILR